MGDISKHFDRREFACSCRCGFDAVDAELLAVLEGIREHFGQPVSITSGCRCEAHNRAVGGETRSQHMLGKAADIHVRSTAPKLVFDYLHSKYPAQYGIGQYTSWVHIDVREGCARWSR